MTAYRARLSILIVVAWVIWPALVLAKPKVAVAPLDGDTGDKVGAIVADAASAHAKVTTAKTVAKALKELSITEPDTSRAAKKLRKHLDVDAVIYGKLERDGNKKTLRLSVYTRGKKPDRFEIEYRLASSKVFRQKLRDELATRLAPDETNPDDPDEDAPTSEAKPDVKPDVKPEEKPDVKPEVKRDRTATEDDKPRRTVAASGDDDDASASVHKHGHVHKKPAAESDRDTVTQAAAFADLGLGGAHRTLTWVANSGGMAPPRVGTGAFAVQFDGEIYPGSFDSLDGVAAALGIFASVNKEAGLSIAIPGAPQSSSISETSFAIGARYRFVFGQTSVAAGLSYWGQSFIADRTTLTSPTQLNTPDVIYRAVAPGGLLRLALSPTIGASLQLDLPLMLSSGPITEPSYYGLASVISFAVQVGVDVALSPHYGLHFGGFFDQESLSFKAGMLSSATDRTMGASAAIALMY